MARPAADDEATKSLKSADESQEAEQGAETGDPKDIVLDAFRKVARGKKN